MIRKAKPSDSKIIAELEKQLFGSSAWSEKAVKEELENANRIYRVQECQIKECQTEKCRTEKRSVCAADSAADFDSKTGFGSDSDFVSRSSDTDIAAYAGCAFNDREAEIMTIGTAKSKQSKGYAGKILDEIIKMLKEKHLERVYLEVRTDNVPALRLYESREFMRIGIRKRYYYPENKDAYTMVLNLAMESSQIGFCSGRMQSGRMQSGRMQSGRMQSGKVQSGKGDSDKSDSGRDGSNSEG